MPAVGGQIIVQNNFTWGFTQGANFPSQNLPINFPQLNQVLGNGAGAVNFVNLYAGTRSVAAGTPDVLDLVGTGVNINNPDGTPCAFADLMVWAVRNNGAAALTMGGGTNDITSLLGATGTVVIPPGTSLFLYDLAATAFIVTPTTADKLQFTSPSGTIPYDLLLAGH